MSNTNPFNAGPGPVINKKDYDDILRDAVMAADPAAMRMYWTEADRTRAIVETALVALLANRLVTITPRSEWPEWVVLDMPPYTLVDSTPEG